MGRYSYKPIITSFNNNKLEEDKYDFIQKYKDSLTTGEIIIDLFNYEIYIANNGLEYPVSTTSETKKDIINYIENEEGPLGILSKNDLLTIKSDDNTEANIIRKEEKIEDMLNDIKKFNKACLDKIDEDENKLKRTNREIENWYDDLSKYTMKKVYSSDAEGSNIIKLIYNILCKYIELYKRAENISNSITKLKNLKIEDAFNDYNDKLKKLFRILVNNEVAINQKLNISEIKDKDGNYITPDYSYNISFNGLGNEEYNNVIIDKFNEIRNISECIPTKYATLDNNTITLSLKSVKKEVKKDETTTN